MAVAAAIGGTAAVTGYMAYEQSEAQKDAQADYNDALEAEAVRQYGELDEIENDIIYESHASSLEAQRQFMQARSDIELGAAASGTYGGAVDQALGDLSSGFGYRMGEIVNKRDAELRSVVSNAEGIRAGAISAGDVTPSAPSWYTAGLAGLQGAAAASSIAGAVSGGGGGAPASSGGGRTSSAGTGPTPGTD